MREPDADLAVSTRMGDDPIARLQRLFAAQQAAFRATPYPPVVLRRARLRALKQQLGRYQNLIADAIRDDFGQRAHFESLMLDVLAPTLEINHLLAHVRRWMRPKRRSPEWLFFSNSLTVRYQPKGVVGVVVPWNFPVYLALGPLAAAIAAGNRVMVKMSELTPATNRVLERLLAEVFTEHEVAVVGEELTDASQFTALAFDHIVFTGSPAVGKLVMHAAANHLIPVTLELGGKSPALVSRHYSIDDAAMRIAHGKATNGGQICVAPDYALVPREQVDAFVAAVQSHFLRRFGGETANNPDYTSVINARHLARLQQLLDDAVALGGHVTICGSYDQITDGRRMPLHIVTNCTPAMRIMQEELFGPILPVLPYDTLADAIDFINAGQRPLALYCFSHDSAELEQVLQATHSGGVTLNDWGWHFINHDAPCGGIGNSGSGSYHGEEGFRELSHARTVFKRRRGFPMELFYPPYGNFIQRWAMRFFIGKADEKLRDKP